MQVGGTRIAKETAMSALEISKTIQNGSKKPLAISKDTLLKAIIALDDAIQQAGKKDEIRPLVLARLFAEEWLRKLDQGSIKSCR